MSREVQSEGWIFNTEEYYEIAIDSTTGEVDIPNNVLQIDLHDEVDNQYEAIRRTKTGTTQPKLYEKINHTYDWKSLTNSTTLRVNIVWLFDWVDLPRPVQDYITARAAAIVSSRIVGDPQQYQILQQKEMYNRAQAMEYECNQGDYTIFGHQRGKKPYNSYKPYQALYR